MDTKDTFLEKKEQVFFHCDICHVTCSKKTNFDRHINTWKHLNCEKGYKKIQKDTKLEQKKGEFICQCGKLFKYHSGLWRHKKKCTTEISSNVIDGNLIIELLNENKEFKQIIIDQNQTIKELATKVGNTTNNKTFNLQFFLNEQCKDALNITEFVSSIKMNLSDLEATGRLGYAEGISKIIMNNLKSLDTCKRPIHCSDLKRETIYIKDNNIWEKDNENDKKLALAIKDIAHENIKQINVWIKENPECKDSSSKKSDQYLKIVTNAMSGSSHEETEKNMEKIISNVAREVMIEKSM